MNKFIKLISHALRMIELLVAIALAGAMLLYTIRLFLMIWNIMHNQSDSTENLEALISSAFTLVIGVEFVRMICHPTTGTVVEVLMFAIGRSMIVGHSSSAEILTGVISIAILLAIKKFLFCDFDDDSGNKIDNTLIYRIVTDLKKKTKEEGNNL